jgi:hypothetical protein
MSSDSSSKPGSGLHDTIITLPVAAIVALGLLAIGGLVFAGWAALSPVQGLQEVAAPLIVVLAPLLFAVVAAVGVRRASVGQIDRLVASFLDVTVRQRLELACGDAKRQRYPFSRVSLVRASEGRSYVEFLLHWAHDTWAPVTVGVKMNVFNIEVFADLPLRWPAAQPEPTLETHFIGPDSLDVVARHAVLQHFQGAIQGSVAEGYEVRATLKPLAGGAVKLHLSIRQKLREHFLASPYLKRYFAEDVAIVVGVIYNEWAESGMALLSPRTGGAE